ncbi:MAG: ISH3 family transposase [Pirellulaceae bacterium]
MSQRLPQEATTSVPAEQVHTLAVETLTEHFALGVEGYRYQDADIFNVVIAAAAQERSIDSVCGQLVQAPSANLVRTYLAKRLFGKTELDKLEAEINATLVQRLPPHLTQQRLQVAIDLTLLPYYGTEGVEPDQLRRGEAKAGTTRFHAYATAFVLQAGKRLTLALTFVYAEEALADIVADLLGRLDRLGIRLRRLFLDREFASVAVLDLLAAQPFCSIVALPKRGERIKALLRGRSSYRTTYTMVSHEDGPLTFDLFVACRYAAGRRDKHGIDYLPFAVVGKTPCELPVNRLADSYRRRFGIETSYRQMNQVKARTTSRYPDLRLFLVGVGFLLTNLWVWLKVQLVAATSRQDRRAARAWLEDAFRLDRFRDLLIEALKARYGVHDSLAYPFVLSAPLKL